jgi:hypothetical protein
MAGSLVASLVIFAVGAVLDVALTASPDQHGFDLQRVGVILMIVEVDDRRGWLFLPS